ncbi:MAG TPA: discoidin domain-containing protein, partial [Bacillota bacterium]|nr:discoidin domain-containing protein [Bacillota bacterium]
NYKTYANWDPQNTFTQSGHVVAPGGALVVAGDGAVTAGVFTAYNGNILGEGDHYLIEVRSKDNIKVFQPIGPNTPIHIKKYSTWPGVKLQAYGYDGKPITEIDGATLKDDVLFDWNRECSESEQTVAWYQLTKANQPNTQGYPIPQIPDLIVTDITWSPAEVSIGDQVTFQATVKNIGTGPTPAGTILGIAFEIDGKPQFWSDYFKEPLAAGAIVTLKVSRGESKPLWEATAGPHVITVWVDKTNKIAEIIENNNRFNKNIPSVDEAVIIDGVRKPKSAANLALNKPVISSGATAPAYREALVNDGFTNSYWESVNGSFPAYLTIDLGIVQNMNRVVLKLPPSWEQRVQTIELQGSAANMEFTKILDAAKYTFDPASQNTVSISIPKTGVRFLKLIFTGNTAWPAGQLAEVEVFAGN